MVVTVQQTQDNRVEAELIVASGAVRNVFLNADVCGKKRVDTEPSLVYHIGY